MSGRRKSARQVPHSEGLKRRKTQEDVTEVLQLSKSEPNPGFRPGPGTGKANENKGPKHTHSPLASVPMLLTLRHPRLLKKN